MWRTYLCGIQRKLAAATQRTDVPGQQLVRLISSGFHSAQGVKLRCLDDVFYAPRLLCLPLTCRPLLAGQRSVAVSDVCRAQAACTNEVCDFGHQTDAPNDQANPAENRPARMTLTSARAQLAGVFAVGLSELFRRALCLFRRRIGVAGLDVESQRLFV